MSVNPGAGLRINWLNYKFLWFDGYGLFGSYFVEAMHNQGVHVFPAMAEQLDWPVSVRALSGFDGSKLTIALMPPYEMKPTGGRIWNFTMYEGTGLEERWIKSIVKYAERVVVPHQFLIDVLRENGVPKHIPIHVVPGGTCPRRYPATVSSPYQAGRPYTFLAWGDRGSRKGWDLVWRAFWDAFGDTPDVRLIVKFRATSKSMFSSAEFDHRVSFWYEDLLDMNELYAQADCMTWPSRGEGWGMPPREFAMTGKPVIATRWSGLKDGIDQWARPISCTLEPAMLRGGGDWAAPSLTELTEQMRWCYDNKDQARTEGLAAAQWLRDNQTWDHAAVKLIDLIREWR